MRGGRMKVQAVVADPPMRFKIRLKSGIASPMTIWLSTIVVRETTRFQLKSVLQFEDYQSLIINIHDYDNIRHII